jgi:hypothetical protein
MPVPITTPPISSDAILVYPDSSDYMNKELGIGIAFPESWVGNVVIIEHDDPIDQGIIVCFREAFEQDPELAISKAVIFTIVTANVNDEAALRRLDDTECFTFIAESKGRLYYLSNVWGSTGSIEVYFNDIWLRNEALLGEMRDVVYGDVIDRIKIYD